MDLSQLLGAEYLTRVESDCPDCLSMHMVRYIQKEVLAKEKKLSSEFVMEVLRQAILHYTNKENVVVVNRSKTADGKQFAGRVSIVGDLHGQYRDLRFLLSPNGPMGFPSPDNQVIFNGDMVDRGDMSVEIVVLLSLMSVLSPGSVHMLKGNHEAERHLTDSHGFSSEVDRKYPSCAPLKIAFYQLFAALPVAAVVDEAVFVVHGGLGRNTHTIAKINGIDRRVDPDRRTMLYELLWNDPIKTPDRDGIQPNKRGEAFGASVTALFLLQNKLKLLVRSHEYCEQGFAKLHNGLCYTVFSAPNYCGRDANKGAVMHFAQADSAEPQIVQFEGHHYSPKEFKFKTQNLTEEVFEDTDLKIALDLSVHFMESAEDAELKRVMEQSLWEVAPACETKEVCSGEETQYDEYDEYDEEYDPELQMALEMSRLQT